MRRLALVAFGLTLVTLPWRQRVILLERPLPPVYADFTDLLLYTHELFLLATLLLWSGGVLLARRRPHSGPFFLWWPQVGLAVMAGVSVITAVDPLLAFSHAVRLWLLLLFYLYVVNEVRSVAVVVWGLAGQVVLQATVAIAQVWRQQHLGWDWLGERALDPFTSSFVWAGDGLRSLRAYGLTDHPNILAAGLVFSLLLLLTWAATEAEGGEKKLWIPGAGLGLALLVLGPGSAALLLTFSQRAWLAFAAGALLSAWLWLRKRRETVRMRALLTTGVVGLCLLPSLSYALPYLRLAPDESLIAARLEERLYARAEGTALTVAANQLFSQHAITGVGIGALPVALRHAIDEFEYDYQPARMSLINVAAETGLVGALFYGLLLAGPWGALLMRRSRGGGDQIDAALAGLYGVLLAVTIFGFMDPYTWANPAGRLWQWLIWGVWSVIYLRTC